MGKCGSGTKTVSVYRWLSAVLPGGCLGYLHVYSCVYAFVVIFPPFLLSYFLCSDCRATQGCAWCARSSTGAELTSAFCTTDCVCFGGQQGERNPAASCDGKPLTPVHFRYVMTQPLHVLLSAGVGASSEISNNNYRLD